MSTVVQPTFVIPTDPAILLKLKSSMQEIKDSKLRAKAEKNLQSEILLTLSEETGIPKNILRKLAIIQSDGGVDKMTQELSDLEQLHHAVNRSSNQMALNAAVNLAMGTQQSSNTDDEEDDDSEE